MHMLCTCERAGGIRKIKTIMLEQGVFALELLVMMKCFISVLHGMVASSYVWLLSTSNVANAAEELNFKFYWILINSNLNNHMWIVVTIWNGAALEQKWDMDLFNNVKVL